MRRLDAVVRAGQDFSLGGVSLEVVDERQDLLLVRPVVEGHGLVRLNVAQHALNVNGDLAMFGALADELAVEVAVYQTGEVIHLGLDVGHFVEAERVALPSEVQARFSLSAVKYWLRMEQVCADGFQYRSALMPSKRSFTSASSGFSLQKMAAFAPLPAAAQPDATTAPPTSLRSLPR